VARFEKAITRRPAASPSKLEPGPTRGGLVARQRACRPIEAAAAGRRERSAPLTLDEDRSLCCRETIDRWDQTGGSMQVNTPGAGWPRQQRPLSATATESVGRGLTVE